jgi:hypothetical protein
MDRLKDAVHKQLRVAMPYEDFLKIYSDATDAKQDPHSFLLIDNKSNSVFMKNFNQMYNI